MTRKKQIIIPIVILLVGIALQMMFASMKKPPEEKEKIDTTPIVAVEAISVAPMVLHVESYGVVQPKYETELVAQVAGQIVELSDTFVRGGFVKKGQLLARIDPNDYQAALIEAQASMASARAALETELAQGKVAEREWKVIKNSSPTELSLRKPQLAQELARVKAAQASVLRAKRNLERTQLRSPYDAMIESRTIGLGSVVGLGSNIGKVFSTGIGKVRLPVADNQLQFLKGNGENSLVTLNGVYAGKNVQWQATIVRNEGVIDNKSRMNYLVAEIVDPYQLINTANDNVPPLRYGSYINASIVGVDIAQASVIPSYLVINNKVALLDKESTLHYADVQVFRQDGSNVIISQGLSDGDQLIVSALDYPVDGMKLALVGKSTNDSDDEAVSENSETQVASNDSGE